MHSILSRLDPRTASLVMRLVNLGARPSLEQCILIIGVGIVLIAGGWAWSALGAVPGPTLLRPPTLIERMIVFGTIGAIIAIIVLPALLAAYASRLVSRDAQSDLITLIRLTPITGKVLFQGYVVAALFKMRLALGIVFLLAWFLGGGFLSMTTGGGTLAGTPTGNRLLMIIVEMILFLLSCWGMNLLAVALGVIISSRIVLADVAAGIATLAVGTIMGMLLALGVFGLSHIWGGRFYIGDAGFMLIVALTFMCTYGLFWRMMQSEHRFNAILFDQPH